MRELDKNCVYSLEDLTSEELNEVWKYLTKIDEDWYTCPLEEVLIQSKTYRLLFDGHNWHWCYISKPTANAKELFYTLENIQVDCRELSDEQIKEMLSVVGDKIDPFNSSLDLYKGIIYFSFNKYCKLFGFYGIDEEQYVITYDKFMELFSRKEEKFKTFTIREYSTGDFMDLGTDAGVIKAKNKNHAWELYKETHRLKDSEKGFYSFTEIAYQPKDQIPYVSKMVSEQPHYDNTKGSIYKFCNDQKLNSWEFDIIKRVVRCRKKGLFIEDLEKTKYLIDLYLKEFEDENNTTCNKRD